MSSIMESVAMSTSSVRSIEEVIKTGSLFKERNKYKIWSVYHEDLKKIFSKVGQKELINAPKKGNKSSDYLNAVVMKNSKNTLGFGSSSLADTHSVLNDLHCFFSRFFYEDRKAMTSLNEILFFEFGSATLDWVSEPNDPRKISKFMSGMDTFYKNSSNFKFKLKPGGESCNQMNRELIRMGLNSGFSCSGRFLNKVIAANLETSLFGYSWEQYSYPHKLLNDKNEVIPQDLNYLVSWISGYDLNIHDNFIFMEFPEGKLRIEINEQNVNAIESFLGMMRYYTYNPAVREYGFIKRIFYTGHNNTVFAHSPDINEIFQRIAKHPSEMFYKIRFEFNFEYYIFFGSKIDLDCRIERNFLFNIFYHSSSSSIKKQVGLFYSLTEMYGLENEQSIDLCLNVYHLPLIKIKDIKCLKNAAAKKFLVDWAYLKISGGEPLYGYDKRRNKSPWINDLVCANFNFIMPDKDIETTNEDEVAIVDEPNVMDIVDKMEKRDDYDFKLCSGGNDMGLETRLMHFQSKRKPNKKDLQMIESLLSSIKDRDEAAVKYKEDAEKVLSVLKVALPIVRNRGYKISNTDNAKTIINMLGGEDMLKPVKGEEKKEGKEEEMGKEKISDVYEVNSSAANVKLGEVQLIKNSSNIFKREVFKILPKVSDLIKVCKSDKPKIISILEPGRVVKRKRKSKSSGKKSKNKSRTDIDSEVSPYNYGRVAEKSLSDCVEIRRSCAIAIHQISNNKCYGSKYLNVKNNLRKRVKKIFFRNANCKTPSNRNYKKMSYQDFYLSFTVIRCLKVVYLTSELEKMANDLIPDKLASKRVISCFYSGMVENEYKAYIDKLSKKPETMTR